VFCSYSVFKIYATCNVISHVKYFVLLHSYFQNVCAMSNMAGFLVFFLISCFPGIFLRYFLNDFEMV
jgi:hypothetical protein